MAGPGRDDASDDGPELAGPPALSPAGSEPTAPSRTPLLIALGLTAAVLVVIVISMAHDPSRDGEINRDGVSPGAPGADQLWGYRWAVIGMSAQSDGQSPPSVPVDGTLTIDFDNDQRIVFQGCNIGSGLATVDGNSVQAKEMASTMMACADADGRELMAYDTWMGRLFADGVEANVSGDRAVLTGPRAQVVLERRSKVAEHQPSSDPDESVSSPVQPPATTEP